MRQTIARTPADVVTWMFGNPHHEGWITHVGGERGLMLRGYDVTLFIPNSVDSLDLYETADFEATDRMYFPTAKGLAMVPRARVVHCKREEFDFYIGRGEGSKFGNPFKIGVHGDRDEVIAMFRQWAPKQPALMKDIHNLHGQTLGCWCAPNACHGHVLADLAQEAFDARYGVTTPREKPAAPSKAADPAQPEFEF